LVVSASGRGHRACEDDLFRGYNIDIAADEGCAIAATGKNAVHHVMLENYDVMAGVCPGFDAMKGQQRSA
jgi:hypothetical protein